jgi:hypothetical protein
MKSVLICLNSAQVVQNVIAALNVRPDRIVLFTTEDVKNQLAYLRSTLSLLGHTVTDVDVRTIHPTRFEAIHESCRAWLAAQDPGDCYILNATGGTKPMSFTVLEVCKGLPDFSAIYVDSDKDQVLTRFYPAPFRSEPIHEFPSIETYLSSYGFRMELMNHHFDSSPYEPLWEQVSRYFGYMTWFFSHLPKTTEGGTIATKQHVSILEKNLIFLEACGILESYQATGREGEYRIVPGADGGYVNLIIQHGWIEEYLAWTLRKMGLPEVIRGVRIIPPYAPNSFAEFDVVARRGARLFMFECKTGGLSVEQEMVHMIESKVRMSAGVFAVPVFVATNRRMNLSSFQSERFRHSRIHLILPDDLPHLGERLEKIFHPTIPPP